MVVTAASVEWIEVRNELEALMLEHSLIKRHHPRFNVRLRDDKSYPFLAVTTGEEWPRAAVVRGRRQKGVRYFGPYAQAWAIREVLDHVTKTFPVRTCSQVKFKEHERLGRPCLLFHIEKCAGPCVGAVTTDDYAVHVRSLVRFLSGAGDEIVASLSADMSDASSRQDFERAARLRDRISAVSRVLEKQQMVGRPEDDLDAVGLAEDELQASIQVLTVRHGRVIGRHGFILDKVEDIGQDRLVGRVLDALYSDDPAMGVPATVLVPVLPDQADAVTAWLGERRGGAVAVAAPQRGDRRALLDIAVHNAADALQRHRMKRASDHSARSRALLELQDLLGLPEAPLRIECYDMAHLQGTDYVGSMVVLEDGLPLRRDYRRFTVAVPGNDDYAAMREVLGRRLRRYIEERDSPPTDRRAKFAYPPQLLLVDGGKGQLSVAVDVVRELGLEEEIPVAALAKRFEEVYLPGRTDPVDVPRGSDALFMLQVVRDEAHRFANAHHRQRRAKRMVRGALDGVPGLGDARKQRLVKAFGGVRGVKAASLEDLLALPWLPDDVARRVHEHLRN
jgi:excinuclease ABC subunit C